MFILHIANKNYSSWSLRPWLLMRSLNIPFQEQIHPFSATTGGWDDFRHFSPTGKVPCLEDGAIRVWDSLAITEYLAESYPQIWPADKTARAWARSAAAEMHSGFNHLRNTCGMSCGHRIKLHEISADLQKDLDRINELWNQGLTQFGGPFLTGKNFTATDAFFAPVVFRCQTYSLPLSEPSHQYLLHMLAQPGMQEWYDEGLKETWRDPSHEQDVLTAGTLLADLRH
jgi:glutathione S-transferase